MIKRSRFSSGEKHNRLTLISPTTKTTAGSQILWLCRCDCGKEIITNPKDVRSSHTRSCGCLRIELMRLQFKTHGLTETREYRAWSHMKGRCNSKTDTKFFYYGGRGIIVCERWSDSFKNFLSDMGKCPRGYSLERKDSNGNYEPSNCEWADDKRQGQNRRNVKTVMLGGIKMPRVEAERKLNLGHGTIAQRAFKRDLTLQQATDYYSKKKLYNQSSNPFNDYIVGLLSIAA